MYSSDKKTVTFLFHATPSGWHSRLFLFQFSSVCWPYMALHYVCNIVPFHSTICSGRKRVLDVKAMPTFHNSSSRKTAFDLGGSRSHCWSSRLTRQHSS